MGLMQKLYETYENNSHMAGVVVQTGSVLAPAYHSPVSAQIEITLTPSGEFFGAASVPKDRSETLIPLTEEAAGRTGKNVVAFPFSDQLKYVAPPESTAKNAKTYEAHHDDFIKNLNEWSKSPGAHYKVTAVQKYCSGGTIVRDLAEAGVISLDDSECFAVGKVEGKTCETAVVRWIVLPKDGDSNPAETWLDQSFIQSYVDYMAGKQCSKDCDCCYITGKMSPVAHNHAKGIVKNVYGAKLISANDSSGFTYRGRFVSASEPVAISDEASQKAHSALKWIVSNQGSIIGGRTFVCWNPKGKSIPNVARNPLLSYDDETPDYPLTMPEYRKQLYKALNGYSDALDERDDVVVLSLEAATLGRLSVTYFNELKASDFLGRLKKWNETCCWYFWKKTDQGSLRFVGSPSIRDIIECAFGNERDNFLKADDAVQRDYSQILLSCIVDSSRIPYTVVHALACNASAPQSYKQFYNREKVVSVACALIRKYFNDENGKEVWTMGLDENCTERSYLFGRLLAVAEKVETRSYMNGEWRMPNAMKLQTVFSRQPLSTWDSLANALEPYYKRLSAGAYNYYKDLIAEIIGKREDKDKDKLDNPLEPTYLLGYYDQRAELNKRKDKNKGEEK